MLHADTERKYQKAGKNNVKLPFRPKSTKVGKPSIPPFYIYWVRSPLSKIGLKMFPNVYIIDIFQTSDFWMEK